MCRLCDITKELQDYKSLIDKMAEEDDARLDSSKELSSQLGFISKSCYSSAGTRVAGYYPLFEARMAYAVPANYFQNIFLDGEKLGNSFSHGSMRSVFFVGDRLTLFSKNVNFRNGREFFTSYLLLLFEPNEYEIKFENEGFAISVSTTKQMNNLVTGAEEKKNVRFTFVHSPVRGRIVTRKRVLTSAQFKSIYSKYLGGPQMRSASIDLEGYAITVPHFAPHPYLLQLREKFGYQSNREFQEHVHEYFAAHYQKFGLL